LYFQAFKTFVEAAAAASFAFVRSFSSVREDETLILHTQLFLGGIMLLAWHARFLFTNHMLLLYQKSLLRDEEQKLAN